MPFLILTGEQIRAARALARWEQTELARRSGLSLETIKRLERIRGPVDANSRTLAAICEAFSRSGVAFENNSGVGVKLQAKPVQQARDELARAGGGPVSVLHRLVYYSTMDASPALRVKPMLDDLLATSRARNEELAITGALFACNGRFLQVLEGGRSAVLQVYGSISTDPRHQSLKLIESRPVTRRQFPEWSLCCGIFENDAIMLEREPAMRDGFHPEALTPASALGLLGMMRDLQQELPRRDRSAGGDCPLAAKCMDQVCAANAAGGRAA